MRYAAAPAGTIRAVPLDALTALYDRRSARTHIVAPPVPELLDVLNVGPGTAADLWARLEERYLLIEGDVAALGVQLDELARLGLVAAQ